MLCPRMLALVGQAIVPAGGLSGRRSRYATNFSGFSRLVVKLTSVP